MKTSTTMMKTLAACVAAVGAIGLQAADRFNPEPPEQPLGAIAPIELSDTNLANGAKAYRTWFENGAWQGDLVEYDVSAGGELTTTIDLSETSPKQTQNNGGNWSAHVQFKAKQDANPSWWVTRKVITSVDGSQANFLWPNLPAEQKTALDPSANNDGSDILDYIRGDRSNEHPSGSLRARYTVLGDIIHSNPTYVGPPSDGLTQSGYASFAEQKKDRDPLIYVGSNDGMLHVFDAATGDEVYAYIPSMIIGGLDQLVGRPYTHFYGVDGKITVKDAKVGSWKTVLVGGLGAGGKGWFALDVTEDTLGNNIVMWELDASSDDDLGYSYSQAVITQLNDGNWYAVFGNGYSSVRGQAVLYIVRLSDGNVKKIPVGNASADSPNGLSSPSLIDRDRDGKADIAYAGDIDGNLWKFDLTSSSRGDWDDAYNNKPLHDGDPSRPILEAPDATLHPRRGYLVFFATGKLLEKDDIPESSVQAMYGIWDLRGDDPPTADAQDLHVQTLSGDLEYVSGDISEVVQTFTPDPGEIDWDSKDGWIVELPAGYKSLTPVTLRGGRVKATLHHALDDENYTIEPYYLDGGAPPAPIFDLNQSDSLTVADNVDGNGDGSVTSGSTDIVAMWKLPNGLMSQTTVGRISNGVDAQLINYLVPPLTTNEPCTGNCSDGFAGGHIDVDTDYYNDDDGVGGGTYEHSHEYDKDTGRVYVDYRDHDPENDHVYIDDAGFIPQSDDFIVVVANADMSPGSVLTVGDVEYNVAEYQRLIHRKLRTWQGKGNPLTDGATNAEGKSLIFSAEDLVAANQTVRHDFNDQSIVAGGVHPTNTGCVNKGDSVTKGRYRNGSLVTQFINLNVFTGCTGVGCSLDKIIIQEPTDLPVEVVLGDETRVPMGEDLNGDGFIKASDYEVYGGLRGSGSKGNTDVLFESTIFWHYDGKACYGDAEWESDVEETRGQYILTEEEWLEMLSDEGYAGKDIDQEYQRVLQCLEADSKDKACKKELEIIEELLDARDLIPGEGGEDDGTGLDSGGETPVTMGGEASDLGVTAGPNFEVGRRTWTDIFDD